ncbi:hypothetical protein ACFL5M_01755 [Candidatus Neomarinimicrobiota bacterium]
MMIFQQARLRSTLTVADPGAIVELSRSYRGAAVQLSRTSPSVIASRIAGSRKEDYGKQESPSHAGALSYPGRDSNPRPTA